MKLAEFSGDPLEWPEWSQLFQATVHAANIDDSVKMNHLKTMVTGKAKEAIAGLGYLAEMYNVAWNVLVRNFGKPQMVVNAQLKRIYSFPPMKPYDGAALIKFARIVSSCVNVLKQFNYVGDLNSEGVLDSATRKLTLDMKTKWLTYVKQLNLYQPGLAVFSEWLNDIADVQDELLLYSNPNADRAKTSYKEKADGSTFASSTTSSANGNSNYQRECALKDGKHPIWKCEKFKKMNVEEKQPTQMQAVKFAAKTITLEEGKRCFQLEKVVGFVKECLRYIAFPLELHGGSRGVPVYQRHTSSGLLECYQPSIDNAKIGTNAANMSFWRKYDVELKEKLQTTVKIVTTG